MTADAVGGVWTYALDLAEGLAARGWRTTLAVLGPAPGMSQRLQARQVPGLDLHLTSLPLDWLAENPGELKRTAAAVARLCRETGAEVAQLNTPSLAALAAFPVPVVSVCHSCLATWWATMRDSPLPPDFLWRTTLLRQGYAASSALVAPTRAFAAATATVHDLAEQPTAVWNGRRPLAWTGSTSQVDSVLTLGRLWDEGKNVAVLDRAAGRLRWPVQAAGATEGPNGAHIALRHIHSLGRLDETEVTVLLAQRPVLASLARYEPFGLAVLEAAQAGCALVLSDIPTFRELWDGAAVFVPPDDEAAVALALDRMMADRAERDRLGDAARERARRYSTAAMLNAMLALYDSLPQPIGPVTMEATVP